MWLLGHFYAEAPTIFLLKGSRSWFYRVYEVRYDSLKLSFVSSFSPSSWWLLPSTEIYCSFYWISKKTTFDHCWHPEWYWGFINYSQRTLYKYYIIMSPKILRGKYEQRTVKPLLQTSKTFFWELKINHNLSFWRKA